MVWFDAFVLNVDRTPRNPNLLSWHRKLWLIDHGLRSSLVGGDGAQAAGERAELAAAVVADVADRDLVEQALYLDTNLFLPDGLLVCADKMSMSASLEQRVPFLDLELMRFVERIPAETWPPWSAAW